jgi:alpha-1,6-mannosyltransferase
LGVDLQTFHPDARDNGLRAELGIAEDTRLLIFAGRGSKEKNLPVLLKCMQRLGPRYHLLLVGSSMPAVVPDNVSVIDGFCPAATVARLMASADALLHAGDQETFGLVILEAMACGIPVVAVAAGAFEEIVADDCGLLCAPNNPQAMANAVRELFSRGCMKLGQQARQHVERRYSWDSVVDSLLGHYHAVLGHSLPKVANG